MKHILILIISLLSIVSFADDRDSIRDTYKGKDLITLVQAIESLPTIESSRIIEVELEYDDDILIYEIERLEEMGIVREYKIDAKTGILLSVEID